MKWFILNLLSGLLLSSIVYGQKHTTIKQNMLIDGVKRVYWVYQPQGNNEKRPLVIVLHGGGGNARAIQRYTRFNELAEKEKFIVAYPDAVDGSWDFANVPARSKNRQKLNDTKFISNLIDIMIQQHPVNAERVFVTGGSRGGMFSIYLADQLSDKILAIAPLIANIPVQFEQQFQLENPVSALLINGTDDPLILYEGGAGKFNNKGSKGFSVISTDKTIEKFVTQNGCNTTPQKTDIPDTDKNDNSRAEVYTYTNGKNQTEVILVKVIGGGHTYPGKSQYLPKSLVGGVCKDFDSTVYIWEFFKRQKTR